MNSKDIKHYTKTIPGIIRNEIYEYEDMKYIERFDDVSNERLYATVTMYDGVNVCVVYNDGKIALEFPTDWVTNKQDMQRLLSDMNRLDEFLSCMCKNY